MKQSIRIIAMLFGCFAIYFILPSCNSSAKYAGKTGQKLEGPILIKGYNTSDNSLTLKDQNRNHAEYVTVSRGQTIDWNVTIADVEIVGIGLVKAFGVNDSDFFQVTPHRNGKSKWSATIGNLAEHKGFIVKYYIRWQLISTGQTYTYDPLLQLNP